MRSHRTAVMALTTAILACPFMQANAGPPVAEAAATATAIAVASTDTGTATAAASATATVVPGAADTRPKLNIFGTAHAVASDKLDGVRGGAETVFNDMKLHGTVAENAAINVRTGGNAIADGSFANSAGLPTVIQNSGANVLIQNATIVNIQFKP